MISEGNVYLCDGSKRRGRYLLTLRENASIAAQGDDLEEVKCDIYDQIIEWNGDGEAVLEVLFPAGGDKSGKNKLTYFSLGYNDSVSVENNEGLYEHDYCPKCRHSIGKRTSKPIQVANKPKGVVCGVKLRYPNPSIFSKKLIDLLFKELSRKAEIRPVLYKGKDSGYVELIPKKFIKHVGYKGAEYLTTFHRSWRCTECGRETFDIYDRKYPDGTKFIARPMIEKNSPEVMFLDTGSGFCTLIRGDIRSDLAKNKEIKRMCTDCVVFIEEDCIEYPDLPEPGEFDWI